MIAATDPPVLDALSAHIILNLLADARDNSGDLRGLSQREIDLKKTAQAALAYWASQTSEAKGRAA